MTKKGLKAGVAAATGIGLLLAITMAPGSRASIPRPRTYSVAPERQCEMVKTVGKRAHTEIVPPSPGLRARAIAARKIRVFWSLAKVPAHCRPLAVQLAILASRDNRATPRTTYVRVRSRTRGSATIMYCKCMKPPDVALAAAYGSNGASSRTVRILIQR